MKRDLKINHEFVKFIPESLHEGTIYISMSYATAVHKCFCGCGKEVVTPFSPTDWTLSFDGETISLDPSIGNWSYPCQSHYWIKHNRVRWTSQWSPKEIRSGRFNDSVAKKAYIGGKNTPSDRDTKPDIGETQESKPGDNLWMQLKNWLSGR